MKKSESIAELAKALNAFQSEVSGAKKSANNPFFKSKYADLQEVINCAKDALHNNGLSVSQFPIAEDGRAGVETILMHSSGEFIASSLMLSVAKNDPQGMGSAITYARRYAYQAVLGIPSEDDDGNSATIKKPVNPPKPVIANCVDVKRKQIEDIAKAKNLGELTTAWNEVNAMKLGADKDILKAKDDKKLELGIS